MFNFKHKITLACILSLLTCVLFASEPVDTTNSDNKNTPEPVKKAVQQWSTVASINGVAIAYINDSRIEWIYSHGMANSKQKVNSDTLFNIASLTKPMFSMMSLQLVENDALELDEQLYKFWIDPDVKVDQRHKKLTARLALSHQSGFANWRGDNPLSFTFHPGQRHQYSGEGFVYLNKAIENKLDTTMPQLMEKYITSPLGMNDTYFGWKENHHDRIVERYNEQGKPLEQKEFYKSSYSAACCTLSTITDYATFIKWVSEGADLSNELLTQLQSPQAQHPEPIEYFGLGWRLVKLPSTTYLVHDGREPGVRTLTIVSPKTGEGLVILTNSSNGELLYRPAIQSTLKEPQDYLYQADKDTWLYLTSQPAEMQPRMLSFIAQSPSFTSKALYAANDAVFSNSNLRKNHESLSELRTQAESAIDFFVLELLKNNNSQNSEKLRQKFIAVMQYLSADENKLLLSKELNKSITVDEWVLQLTRSLDVNVKRN
ncbi:hypothetical protein GCM10009123_07340 [Kangiella japonica]|uniref:Beta-lactamase-related domain-containing protein n=1 Tax=Kangiella japonica TaxID=647384 RepID=A0ABP3CFF2_9GAMM